MKARTRALIRYWSDFLSVPKGDELRVRTAQYLREERKCWNVLRKSKRFSAAYAALAMKHQQPYLPPTLKAG